MLAPRSALDTLRTCLAHVVNTTLQTLATVVKPVSLQFQMVRALKLPDCNTLYKYNKEVLDGMTIEAIETCQTPSNQHAYRQSGVSS